MKAATKKQVEKRIASLEKSIALQERTRANLASMGIDASGTIELTDQIIATLRARIEMHRNLMPVE